jgi:hypothetical protein
MKNSKRRTVDSPNPEVASGRTRRAGDMREVEISCSQVLRELSNYIDQDTNSELRAQIEVHLSKCTRCTAVYDGVRNVIRLVGDGRSFELPPGFSERLHKKLAEKIRP